MSRSSTAIALLSLLVAAHGRPLPVCTLNPSTALHATVKHVVGYSEEAKAQNGGAMMPYNEEVSNMLDRIAAPRLEHAVYAAGSFDFLLPDDKQARVGETYSVQNKSALLKILNQIHGRCFMDHERIPQGGAFEAVVAARAEGLVKIIFRAHAEFELLNHPDFNYNPSATTGDDQAVMYNGGESEFFYFTPSQFLGEVVMKADGGRVMFADIRVPSGRTNSTSRGGKASDERVLNVDLEWTMGASHHEVEIVRLPEMRLRTPCALGHVKWDEELALYEAEKKLEQRIFPFLKKIDFVFPFGEAFARAKKENKKVHCMMLWGALDDQSCCGSARNMRDGHLKDDQVASILEDNYISTWVLLDDIKAIIADFSKSKTNAKTLSEKAKTEARLAEAILSAYQFPVETMVYTPDGDLIWRMNSNVNFHGKFKFNRDSTTGDMFVDDIGMKKTITEADYGGITLAGTGEHEMTKETQNKYAQLKIQEFRALVPPKAGQLHKKLLHKLMQAGTLKSLPATSLEDINVERDVYVHMFLHATQASPAQYIDLEKEKSVFSQIQDMESSYPGLADMFLYPDEEPVTDDELEDYEHIHDEI